MKLFLLAGLWLAFASVTVQAEESPKKSGWLKSLGKTWLEEKTTESETSTPVVGTRGWTDASPASQSDESQVEGAETEIKACGGIKPACGSVQSSTPTPKTSR